MAQQIIKRVKKALDSTQTTGDLIINVDSRHVRLGDHQDFTSVLGKRDTVVFSPNIHELRAYNRLTLIARGEYVVFIQDDDQPPLSDSWLQVPLELFDTWPQAGSIGLKTALFFVSGDHS